MTNRSIRRWALVVGACLAIGGPIAMRAKRAIPARGADKTAASRLAAPRAAAAALEGGVEFAFRRSREHLMDNNVDNDILLCQGLCPPVEYQNYPFRPKFPDRPFRADNGFLSPLAPEFQTYQQGEYVVRSRTAHVQCYRLREDDELDFVYRLTREETARPYQMNVGDEIRVESFTDRNLDRSLIVQPDGTITLALLGQVRATHHTVAQLRDELEELYKKYYKVPSINVTPLKVNTKLEDMRATVDSRAGTGGQTRRGRVTPEGTVWLPGIGSVTAIGLTLDEFRREINAHYATEVDGLEVTPILATRAPRYVFVQGEVKNPGRYTLDAPTTVMQAITMAGGWNIGANISQVVVLRRNEEWRLEATMLDLRQALLGRRSFPVGEIFISDADLIIVPKSELMLFDNLVNMVFTKGLYAVAPFTTVVLFTNLSSFGTAAAAASPATN